MKLITLLLTLTLSLNAYSYWCGHDRSITTDWGDEVDVECTEEVNFLILTSIPVQSLVLTVEEYGGFECKTDIYQVMPDEVQVSVYWLAGADLGGCILHLKSVAGEDLGTSELFMVY